LTGLSDGISWAEAGQMPSPSEAKQTIEIEKKTRTHGTKAPEIAKDLRKIAFDKAKFIGKCLLGPMPSVDDEQ
jgi:hypothetical protein